MQDLRKVAPWLICQDVLGQNIEVFIWGRSLNGGRYERGDKEEFWQRPSHGATRPFCPTSTMLTPRVLIKHWFMLHFVMAHSAIKYALLALPSHFLTRNTLKFCQERGVGQEEEDAGLSNSSSCQAIQSSGRPSYSTPSTLSWSHSQFKPFRSRQNRDDRQIPTHTDTVE